MKIFEKWTTSLIALALIGIVIIGAYHFAIKPNLPPEQMVQVGNGTPAKPSFESIDSSSCILCHTNEAVISASKVGQEEETAEASGG